MRAVRQVKAFPYVFYHSLTTPAYYKEVLKSKASFSFKYFFVLAGLASFITTLFLTFKIAPTLKDTFRNTLNAFVTAYPSDLEITSKDNQWSVNKPEPVLLVMPAFQNSADLMLPKYFIVFDKQGTIDDVKKYDTLILVNNKNILVQSNASRSPNEWNGKLDVYPIKEIPSGTFSKDRLIQAVNNIEQLTGIFEFLIILILGTFILIYNYIYRLFYLFIIAIFIWALSKILGLKFKFMDAYRIGIHSITLPLVIELMLITTGLNFNMPVWFLGLNIIFASIVVVFLSKNERYLSKK